MVNPKILINNLDVLVTKGKDAETFLQGQITNDIKIIKNEEGAIYAGYCSPKGRLIAFFLIIKAQDCYFLICPSSIGEEISKKLSMYIMRSDVTLHKAEEISFFSFYGNVKEEKAFKGLLDEAPIKVMQTVKCISESGEANYFTITKLPGEENRYFVLGEGDLINSIYNELDQTSGVADYHSWNASDIEAKIPSIFKETQDQFIPQSLNLDLIGAVNFKKGCYTGQEIVARTHYLGQTKRRMYLGSSNLNKAPQQGDSIMLDQQKVGQLVNSYKLMNNSYRLLFELKIKNIDSELKISGNIIEVTKKEKSLFKDN